MVKTLPSRGSSATRRRPTIAGDVIRLKVKPEVSSLDFNNGLTLQGFRIPSLITRRAETDVELRDGQSFAIAGLMDNRLSDISSKVPGLGHIPIIGAFFRSDAQNKNNTELLVMITPRLGRVGLFDFHCAEETIGIGAEAAKRSMQTIHEAIEAGSTLKIDLEDRNGSYFGSDERFWRVYAHLQATRLFREESPERSP